MRIGPAQTVKAMDIRFTATIVIRTATAKQQTNHIITKTIKHHSTAIRPKGTALEAARDRAQAKMHKQRM